MIRAIQTHYAGHLFRSRLEARWAVALDSLRLVWSYEPEGFDLGGNFGYYLPDFYVDDVGWLEIKPKRDPDNGRLIGALSEFLGDRGYLLEGTIPRPDCEDVQRHLHITAFDGKWTDERFAWCICPICGRVGIEFEGRGDRVCGSRCVSGGDRGHNPLHPRLQRAFEAARSARYERGEVPVALP